MAHEGDACEDIAVAQHTDSSFCYLHMQTPPIRPMHSDTGTHRQLAKAGWAVRSWHEMHHWSLGSVICGQKWHVSTQTNGRGADNTLELVLMRHLQSSAVSGVITSSTWHDCTTPACTLFLKAQA